VQLALALAGVDPDLGHPLAVVALAQVRAAAA
jgi:hypothetical protein